MSLEIERKFLVKKCVDFDKLAFRKIDICQGYLSVDPDLTVRLRICDDSAFITVKTRNHGAVRNEWEYPIPVDDARQMLERAHVKTIVKTRYLLDVDNHIWEVDIFGGSLHGLIIAEVELRDAKEKLTLPDFVETEVTGNPVYYNSNLIGARYPIE